MRRVNVITIFVALICAMILVLSVTMSATLRPLKRQIIYPALPPTPAPTAAPTVAPTTTTTTTTIITQAPTLAPTAAPTFAPLTIVCPPDINITLGSSLGLPATGYPMVSGGDVPACGAPVAYFRDAPIGIVARSPSFNDANIVPGTYLEINVLGGGANGSYISSALASDDGTVLYATQNRFELSSGGGEFTLNGVNGSIYWDGSASRWIIIESLDDKMYMHLNNTGGGWDTLTFNISGVNPQLGVWPRAYVVTISNSTNHMCVLDRLSILAGDSDPLYFCETSILGLLSGFDPSRQAWTPLGSVYVDNVLPEIESAGTSTIGAVFMRHHDDELHNGASTPLFDWIQVEHWTNINFTTRDYVALRYTISINDFDSTYLPIQTPGGVLLDPRRENIMPRLMFQTQHNTTAVVFTAQGQVVWVELKWQTPTNILAARFILSQQNTTQAGPLGLQRWLPTAMIDTYGTLVVGYNAANNDTVWPSMYAASRLMNDPRNRLREEVSVYDGTPSAFGSQEWGPWSSLSSVVPREFLFSGQVSQGLHVARRLRITGNVIERTFFGENQCNITTCIQIIIEQ